MDEKDLDIDKSLFKQQMIARERINQEKNNPNNWSNTDRLRQINEAEKALQDDIQVILTAQRQRKKMASFKMPEEKAPVAPEPAVKEPVVSVAKSKPEKVNIPNVTPLVKQRTRSMKNGDKFIEETFKTDEMLGFEMGSTLAQFMQEASLNPNTVAKSTNAKGLAQVLPSTLKEWEKRTKRKYNPFDPLDAVLLNRLTMEENLRLGDGTYEGALKIYHGGTNENNWGPKTKAYPDLIKKRLKQVIETQVATLAKNKSSDGG